ncbi:heme/hemin ABC transporter substrate-binding protein [Mesorhizobium sp. A556]
MSSLFKLARAAVLGLSLTASASSGVLAAEGVVAFPPGSKIASIGGSLTEIVFALGEQERLVARDSTSVYPSEALALPDVGYMRQLSPEGVLSANPSGILALQGSGPREAIDVLKKASIPYVEVPESFDHAGIIEKIRIVGKALDVESKADALAASVDAKLKAVESRTGAIKERKRVLFILSMQGGKIMAAGMDTAANGIIALAGGINAVDGYSGYKQLSDEAVLTADPDIVLMMDRGGGPDSSADPFENPAIAATPAGKARKLVRMDGGYLLGFGPRTADAIHDLAGSLYGPKITD